MNKLNLKSIRLILIWSLFLLVAVGISVMYAYQHTQLRNHAELIEQRSRHADISVSDRQLYYEIRPQITQTIQYLELSLYFLAFFALQCLLILIKNQHKFIQFVCRSAGATVFWIINLYLIRIFVARTNLYPLLYLLIILPVILLVWIFYPQIKLKYARYKVDREYAQNNGMAYFHFYPHASESVSMTDSILLQFSLMAVCIVISILFFPSKKFISTAPLLFAIAFFIKSKFYKNYERNFTVNEYLSMVLATICMSVLLSATELLLKIGSLKWYVIFFTFMVVLSIQTIVTALAYFPYKRELYYK